MLRFPGDGDVVRVAPSSIAIVRSVDHHALGRRGSAFGMRGFSMGIASVSQTLLVLP